MSLLLVVAVPSAGEVYRYQDADGRWHFTDRAPPGQGVSADGAAGDGGKAIAGRDLAAALSTRFGQGTPLQQATLAAVAVKAAAGQGAGFFISEDGYILTNRHVVRPGEDAGAEVEQQLALAEGRLAAMELELAARRRQLADAASELAAVQAGEQRDLSERQVQREYDYFKSAADTLAAQVSESERDLREARREREFRRNSALVQQSFTVVLKDGQRLTARLIGVSSDQDLALLKLDGYRTPALTQADGRMAQPGETVYAIGNPLGVSDMVTTGRVTRIASDQIMTDVQLLPGNSGGPLVNESGEVLAVNFAKLTQGGNANYQGFGMAIPIAVARREFPELR